MTIHLSEFACKIDNLAIRWKGVRFWYGYEKGLISQDRSEKDVHFDNFDFDV